MVPSETNLALHQLHVNLRESGEYELIKQRVLAYGNSQSAMEASGTIPKLNNPRLMKEEIRGRDGGGGGSGRFDAGSHICIPAAALKGVKGGSSSNSSHLVRYPPPKL